MPEMSRVERAWCRSHPWRIVARRVVLPWALQGTRPAGHALEIGAGSGAMAAALLSRFQALRLVVTDCDPVMVATATDRLRDFADRSTVQQADATALPFDDARFDLVFSFIMLHHVVQWETTLSEVARVLRPDGLFVGYDLAASAPMRMLHQVQREQQRMVSIEELQTTLDHLPFDSAVVRPAAVPVVMRFRATRSVSG